MKRFAIIFATLFGFSAMATGTEVPASVATSFHTRYPHVENVCWEQRGSDYVADFFLDKHEAKAHFAQDGSIREVDVLVAWKQMPSNIKMYMYKHYHTFALQECDVVEHKGHQDGYAVDMIAQGKAVHLEFNKDGNLRQ